MEWRNGTSHAGGTMRLFAIALLIAGCDSLTGAEPHPWAGAWILQTVDGDAVPTVPCNGADRYIEGRLLLRTDSTYELRETVEDRGDGSRRVTTEFGELTADEDPGDFDFEFHLSDDGPPALTVTLVNGRLRYSRFLTFCADAVPVLLER